LTNEELWRGLLTGEGSPIKHDRARYRRLPGRPRCKTCLVPLGGRAAPLIRLITHRAASRKNPNYCNLCEDFVRTHPGGAEVELSLLFADVRGSTTLAEGMGARDFTQLMNRFYGSANRVLIDSDAIIDKLVGDEVIGLYLPFVGPTHARLAVEAARKLLQATGHEDVSGPWLPVGAGVHTGPAYVGAVGTQDTVADFTAMGDAVNITARLASLAGPGEVLITEAAHHASGLSLDDLAIRDLELKGRKEATRVRVLRVAG
jgi:adenylate cyclase